MAAVKLRSETGAVVVNKTVRQYVVVLVWWCWKPETTELSRKMKNRISFLLLIVKQQAIPKSQQAKQAMLTTAATSTTATENVILQQAVLS